MLIALNVQRQQKDGVPQTDRQIDRKRHI